jgi:outer membrane protein insertion porin family
MSRLGSALLAALVLGSAGPAPLRAQDLLHLVNSETTLSSVELRFPEGRSVDAGLLKRRILFKGLGWGSRLQDALDFLPLISPPRRELFRPPELLRDRTRLRRFYREAGFPDARVEYEVRLDTLKNRVDVAFLIYEGPPRLLESLQVSGLEGGPVEDDLPPELRPAWATFMQNLQQSRGERLGEALRIQLQDRVANWLRNRGFPFPTVEGEVGPEEGGAALTIMVNPGPRLRVGEVRVEGADVLSDAVLRREVALRPGAWFSQNRLTEGGRELLGLDMVRFATLRPLPPTPGDTTVVVHVQVDDGLPRLVSGQLGYTTQSGLSGDASWSHRNFLGGARILEASTSARTGWLGPQAEVARRYGLTVLLRQPYFLHRRLAGVVRPFAEYRDDVRDRSVEGGAELGVLFERGPQRNVSLQYALSYREILDARPGGTLGLHDDLLGLITNLDTLDLNRRTGRVSLAARWGGQGRGEQGLRRWDVRGDFQVAGLLGLSTVEYGKVVMEGSVSQSLLPWLRVQAQAGGGRVFPYGASVPREDESDRLEVYLRLRDATLTAGGAYDVRGWGNELLGPKIPDLWVASDEALRAGRYIPLGGLARWTASLQLEVPFPFLGWPHGSHVFLDGGRVWTPDDRFLPTGETLFPDQDTNEARFGAGFGVSFSTPVGPLQIDLGYKLNPALQDVRNPGAVARALSEGEPIRSVPEEALLRWHLHFSIGSMW